MVSAVLDFKTALIIGLIGLFIVFLLINVVNGNLNGLLDNFGTVLR